MLCTYNIDRLVYVCITNITHTQHRARQTDTDTDTDTHTHTHTHTPVLVYEIACPSASQASFADVVGP